MIDNKKLGLGFIIVFILLVLYTGLNNQKFVDTISSGAFGSAILYYVITRIDYLFILISIFLLRISTPSKEFIGGILLIWAIDITSMPRLPMAGFPTDASFLANSDFIFMSRLIGFTNWDYAFAWKFYYIVLPIILIILAGYILGLVNIGKKFAK